MPDDTSMELKFAIGQPVRRTEDPKLLRGEGKYTDDYNVPGQAYAYILRSMIGHGSIISIDVDAAIAAPGVQAIYTGEDMIADGIGDLPCLAAVKNRDGSAPYVPPHPPLCVGRVRHVGDPIAIVIAESQVQARNAAEMIEVDIDQLPAVTDPVKAVQPDAPKVWDDTDNNVSLDFYGGDEEAEVTKAFEKAHHVSRITLTNTRIVVNAMEPRAVVGEYDSKTEQFTVHAGTQGVSGHRNAMANAIFKVPLDKVRVISNEVGGSFGMKGTAFGESAMVLYAARKLGRAVKWCADRSESFMSDHHGRASVMNLELALDSDGHFLALRANGFGDVGAYLTPMGFWPASMVTFRNIISVYKTPLIAYAVKCVFTNTVPTGPYRGAGRPESKYFLERLIDQAAREMAMDRIEIRRKNMISTELMPYQTPVGLTYDSGEFEAIMDEVLKCADWEGFPKRRQQSEINGKLRGIGIGPYLETTAPPGTELADIRFGSDGTVTLVTGTKDMGTGHAAAFAQVVADRLGVPFESVRLIQSDSDEMSDGAGGSGGSRSMMATGNAIVEVSDVIIENGRKLAGHVLETATEDIEFEHGVFRVTGTDKGVEIRALAAQVRKQAVLPKGLPETLDNKVKHSTAPITFPNGCHICELEIDPETGSIEILRYTVVDDVGVVVNPLIVEGQIHGGIAQGIGQVLLEETVYSDDGQLLTGSFLDYAMPRADNLINVDFSLHPVPCTTNSLGVKGCGEAGNGGSYPATICAILDALASRGVTDIDIPATPNRVWTALQAAQR